MRHFPGQEPQKGNLAQGPKRETGTTPRGGNTPGHPFLATPKCCTLLFSVGQHAQGRGGEASMKPHEGKHAETQLGFRGGGYLPRRGPSTPRVAPRVLCPSPFRCAASAAPPQGRGPLFTSPGRYRNRLRDGPGAPAWAGAIFLLPGCHRIRLLPGRGPLRDGHGAPAWAGASVRFPRSPPESTTGWARRPCQAPPASLRAFLFRVFSHRP